MSVIVTDQGFTSFEDPAQWIPSDHTIDLASDTDPAKLPDLLHGMELVRVDFPSFADGRGFTLARLIRQYGFQGHLRAKGHVIADQYAMARRSGFDDVEIDEDLAKRQPQEQWIARSAWQSHDYQSRLRGIAA